MKATNLITHLGMSVSLPAVLLMLCVGMAQAVGQVHEEWVARYNGPGNRYDHTSGMALDASGNVYVTGSSRSGASFESQDYATIKYDSAGNQLWVARYNGPGNAMDRPSAIALDKSGNVYVTGYCDALGSTWSTTNYATVKYDAAGNELWAACYNGPGNDRDHASNIAVDTSGNVYVTGFSEGGGTYAYYATIKYDTNGNQLWVRLYNGPANGYDQANAMALDASGNVYVTGYSRGSGTGDDYATIKYDTNGNELWVARYNSGNAWPEAIAVDASGNVYVTGFSGTEWNHPDIDYVTVKYDANGNELWVRRYNGLGNDDDRAKAIALDASGNVYVTGQSVGRDTGRDSTTIKYDTTGKQLWVAHYNGPGNDYDVSSAIALDVSCNVYVTGSSKGSGTDRDYATIKYSQRSPQTGDLDCDNDVDLADFGFFTGHWLETDCGLCGGADFSGDGDVDLEDFAIFAAQWLAGVE